ncbi:MAG: hypothetical protein ACYCUG_16785 [Acidimicrobiales bacterium]
MLLTLGGRRHDLATRALVVGVVDDADPDVACRRGERLVADGADLLEVGGDGDRAPAVVAALRRRFDVALSVRTSSGSVAAEAYRAGAVMGHDTGGFADAGYLPAAAAAGAAVVATGVEAVAWARRAGLPDDRIVLGVAMDPGKSSPPPAAFFDGSDRLGGSGVPLMLCVPESGGAGREAMVAALAVGVSLGARLLRSGDVVAARRVRDTLAAVLEAS